MNALTTIPNIEGAWHAASDEFGWPDFAALQLAGVDGTVLASAMAQRLIGADDICIRDGRWERRFRGRRAVVLPVWQSQAADIVDLVAFRPEAPKAFWLLTGHGVMLGAASAIHADYYDEPLLIHETPLDWLKAGGDGAVILDWRHYWPLYMGSIKTVRVVSLDFGRRLRAAMQRPLTCPEIEVAV